MNKYSPPLEYSKIRELFTVDFDKGKVYWKIKCGRGRPGIEAGMMKHEKRGNFIHSTHHIYINRHSYTRARIIFCAYNKRWVKTGYIIDHINGDSYDDCLSNLREATRSEDSHNRHRAKPRLLPIGVTLDTCKKNSKYRAQIFFQNKNHQIGYFNTIQEASCAYQIAHKRKFGEFSPGQTSEPIIKCNAMPLTQPVSPAFFEKKMLLQWLADNGLEYKI